MKTQKPQYPHDCEKCIFLGRFPLTEHKELDLYWHGELLQARHGAHPTAILMVPIQLSGGPAWFDEAKRRVLDQRIYASMN